MVLELSETFSHSCNSYKEKPNHSEEDLQKMMIKLMNRCGIDSNNVNLKDNGVIEVKDTPNLKLHSFMLQAEELGLEWKFTKKTLIEIC
jgi:hypothetical protein